AADARRRSEEEPRGGEPGQFREVREDPGAQGAHRALGGHRNLGAGPPAARHADERAGGLPRERFEGAQLRHAGTRPLEVATSAFIRIAGALLTLGAVLSLAGASSAQSPAKPAVVGLLDAGERRDWGAAFKRQWGPLAHTEGGSLVFAPRYAAGSAERLPVMAKELTQLNVRVIVTGGSVATRAAIAATTTIPIVTATGDDPVAAGI